MKKMTVNLKRSVQFPSLPDGEAVKLTNMLDKIAEFMDCEITVQEIRAINIEFPAERTDVAQFLNRIAAAKKEALGLTKKKAKA